MMFSSFERTRGWVRRVLLASSAEKAVARLSEFGIEARILREESGGFRFHFGGMSDFKTIAEIEVDGCAIGRIRFAERWEGGGSDGPDLIFYTRFVVPDPRFRPTAVGAGRPIGIAAIRRKQFPVFGPVRRVDWRCKELPVTALDELNAHGTDLAILVASRARVEFDFAEATWTLSVRQYTQHIPDHQEWEAYLVLASYLLRVPLTLRR